jgi:hypothetical protein
MSRRALLVVGLCLVLAVGSGLLLAKEKRKRAKANEALPQEAADSDELTPELMNKVQEVLHSRSDEEMHRRYRTLFEAAGAEGLRKLKMHRIDGIALQAAWEEVLLTIPEKECESTGQPDSLQVGCFLDFIEQRVGLDIPQWWRREFQFEIGAHRRDNVWFRMSDFFSIYHEAGFGSIRAPNDTTLLREWRPGGFSSGVTFSGWGINPNDRTIFLQVGEESVVLPDSIVDEIMHLGESDCVSALISANKYYLAIDGRKTGRYDLVCLKSGSGEILWRTQGWGSPSWVSIRGKPGDHWMTVTRQGDRIVVFGVGGLGAHVEAFDAKTGSNIFRFSTSY